MSNELSHEAASELRLEIYNAKSVDDLKSALVTLVNILEKEDEE